METTAEHPNAGRARAYLDAHASGDLDRLAEFLHPDVVWRVGGSHRLSGEYAGKDAVVGYLEQTATETDGSLRLEPEAVLAGDRHLALFLQVTARRGDRMLDAAMTQVVRLADDGRWEEFWALSEDQDQIDAFWGGDR